jgi:hypothetical protein
VTDVPLLAAALAAALAIFAGETVSGAPRWCAASGTTTAAAPPQVIVVPDGRAGRSMRHLMTTATAPRQSPGGKGDQIYPAIGAGHFIKSLRDEGRFVTLEDNSVWEIEPSGRYLTAQWEVLAGISIRHSGGDDGFIYEIANLDKDEGASARWLRP